MTTLKEAYNTGHGSIKTDLKGLMEDGFGEPKKKKKKEGKTLKKTIKELQEEGY